MRLGLVVNPRARGASDPQLPSRLRALAEQAGARCQLVVTQQPEDLPQAAAGLAAFGMDVLAVCGGDGTLMTTLSAMAAGASAQTALPPLLLLPAGTMNTVAKNLGLPRRPEALLQAVLAVAARRGVAAVPFWPQDTLRVRTYGELPHHPDGPAAADGLARARGAALPEAAANPAHALTAEPAVAQAAEAAIALLPQRERCGFLFSGAMGARFLSVYTGAKEPGLRWATLLALRTIASCLYPGGGKLARWLFAPTPMRLTVEAVPAMTGDPTAPIPLQIVDSFRLLLAATVSDAGLGMRVPWRAGAVPGCFHLIASAISTLDNALQLPRILRAQPMRGTPHHDLLARSARLRFAEAQTLVLDGELFRAAVVDLALGPRLRVLRPSLLPP